MLDARISVGLPSHPKTKKLIRRIGEAGAWRLVCLFLWVAQSRPDGDLSGMTGEDIELAADWQGDEGAFVTALIEVGFVDGQEGSYAIHDWAEHNPWAAGADARSEKAKWLALCKHHGRAKAAGMMPDYAARLQPPASSSATAEGDDATSRRNARNSSAPLPSPSPLPLPSPSTSERTRAEQGAPHDDAQSIAQAAGGVCSALREEGLQTASASHPKLLALLEAGITPDEIIAVAKEPAARIKGFAWILAAAEGRRRDAAAVRPLPVGPPAGARASPRSRHSGFENLDYRAGVNPDGSF